MMEILHERRLSLSRKKTRMGCIKKGFHFLGINYPGTQPQDNTTVAHSADETVAKPAVDYSFALGGGVKLIQIIRRMPFYA